MDSLAAILSEQLRLPHQPSARTTLPSSPSASTSSDSASPAPAQGVGRSVGDTLSGLVDGARHTVRDALAATTHLASSVAGHGIVTAAAPEIAANIRISSAVASTVGASIAGALGNAAGGGVRSTGPDRHAGSVRVQDWLYVGASAASLHPFPRKLAGMVDFWALLTDDTFWALVLPAEAAVAGTVLGDTAVLRTLASADLALLVNTGSSLDAISGGGVAAAGGAGGGLWRTPPSAKALVSAFSNKFSEVTQGTRTAIDSLSRLSRVVAHPRMRALLGTCDSYCGSHENAFQRSSPALVSRVPCNLDLFPSLFLLSRPPRSRGGHRCNDILRTHASAGRTLPSWCAAGSRCPYAPRSHHRRGPRQRNRGLGTSTE